MLKKLLDKGVEIELFEISALKNLDKSCAEDAEVEVIDYDLVKTKIFQGLNNDKYRFNMLKSCDAIKIIHQEKRLDFIELKGITTFSASLREESREEAEKKIDDQLTKFDLPNKIFHSLSILSLILQMQEIQLSKKEKVEYEEEVVMDYIIVIDAEIEKEEIKKIGAMMDFLSETSDFTSEIIIRLESVLDSIKVLKVSKPLLKFQSQIDRHYEGYLRQ